MLPLHKRLGRRIRQIRLERGLAHADVAWESEPALSRSHLANIENGKKMPSLRVLAGIAERLGVEPFVLLVFAEGSVLAEVVELARRLPARRLRDLRAALRQEVEPPA